MDCAGKYRLRRQARQLARERDDRIAVIGSVWVRKYGRPCGHRQATCQRIAANYSARKPEGRSCAFHAAHTCRNAVAHEIGRSHLCRDQRSLGLVGVRGGLKRLKSGTQRNAGCVSLEIEDRSINRIRRANNGNRRKRKVAFLGQQLPNAVVTRVQELDGQGAPEMWCPYCDQLVDVANTERRLILETRQRLESPRYQTSHAMPDHIHLGTRCLVCQRVIAGTEVLQSLLDVEQHTGSVVAESQRVGHCSCKKLRIIRRDGRGYFQRIIVEDWRHTELLEGIGGIISGTRDSRPVGTRTPQSIYRSEERRVGKECRSRWSPCQAEDGIRDA